MDFITEMKTKAQQQKRSVVFPESDDDRILNTCKTLLEEGIAQPILIGESHVIKSRADEIGLDLAGIEVFDNRDQGLIDELSADYDYSCGLSENAAKRLLKEPVYFAARMVKLGRADTMVAGLRYTTGEVVLASQSMIGMEEGIQTPSSLFLMRIPDYDGPEGEYLIFADGGVCPSPTPEELADIAKMTARTAKRLLGWGPRVAMISFSTKGSAVHPAVDHVLEALRIARECDPELLIDGELQVDAAIVPEVAARKVEESSSVAGRANILIFPDLDAANAAYKLVQRLAKADAYGPFLQGFAKSVSDLSRGSTVEDIIGVVAMTIARTIER